MATKELRDKIEEWIYIQKRFKELCPNSNCSISEKNGIEGARKIIQTLENNEIIKDFLQESKEQGTHNSMENKKFSDGEAINDWWFDMMVEGDEEPVRRILDELPEFRKEWDDFQFKREQKKKEIAAELEEEKRIARWMSEQRKHYAMGTLEKRYIDRLEALDWWSWRAEGDYYCHCGKQYNSKQGLKRHKKRKHKNPPPPPFYEEPIPLADEGGDILPPAYVEE